MGRFARRQGLSMRRGLVPCQFRTQGGRKTKDDQIVAAAPYVLPQDCLRSRKRQFCAGTWANSFATWLERLAGSDFFPSPAKPLNSVHARLTRIVLRCAHK